MLVIGVESGSPRNKVPWLNGAKLTMGFGDILQKAVYLGVGIATYAAEQAGSKLVELRAEAQKLADELVKRGEMNSEEARRFVDDLIKQAQQPNLDRDSSSSQSSEPRPIEILDEEEGSSGEDGNVNQLRQQVEKLQQELRNLQQDS